MLPQKNEPAPGGAGVKNHFDDDDYYYSESEGESPRDAKPSTAVVLPSSTVTKVSQSLIARASGEASTAGSPVPTVAPGRTMDLPVQRMGAQTSATKPPAEKSFFFFKKNESPALPQPNKQKGKPLNLGPPVSAQTKQNPNAPRTAGAPSEGVMSSVFKVLKLTPDRQRAFFMAFFVYNVVSFFFLVLQCPLSQLDEAGGGCYTFWGYKAQCDTVSYTYRPSTIPCRDYVSPLQAGAAFSILSILSSFFLTLMTWKVVSDMRAKDRRLKRKIARQAEGEEGQAEAPSKELFVLGTKRWIMLGVFIICFVCTLISFIPIVSLYNSRPCQNKADLRTTAYGSGFGLLLTSWVFSLLFLPLFAYVVARSS